MSTGASTSSASTSANHASRYADGKVVPVKGRHLKRVK